MIRYPEKQCICKECPKGAAVQLEEGLGSLGQSTRLLRSLKKDSEAEAEKQQAPPWPDLEK